MSGLADEPVRWPVVSSAMPFVGRLFSLRQDAVALDDEQVVRDYLVHPGAVGVIAVDDAERVLLVHQYRHPVGARLWEPPAGLLDMPGEDPLVAARRELREEAHHRASDWRVLVDAFTSPGCSNESVRIYLARGLSQVGDDDRYVGRHEELDMPVDWVGLDEVVAHILAGDVHNPLLIMGAMAAVAARAGGWAGLRPADAPWPYQPAAPSP
jgi:ADP-ribose pyrophosphatase